MSRARDIADLQSGSVSFSSDLTVGDDIVVTDDIFFNTDGSIINFGINNEVTLTHVHNTGLLLNSTNQFQFGDSGTYIHQSADGVLDLVSDTEIEINATTIDMNGIVEVSGTSFAALRLKEGDTTNVNTSLFNSSGDFVITTSSDDSSSTTDRIRLDHATGDISFYEDTGSSVKFFWDASEERLGIGTTSPSSLLTLHGTQPIITLSDPDTSSTTTISGNSGHLIFNADSGGNASNNTIDFQIDNDQKMRIDSNGSVGIGCTPDSTVSLDVQNLSASSNNVFLRLRNTTSLEDTGIIIDGNNGGQREYKIGVNSIANSSDLTFSGPTGYRYYIGSSEAMRITSSGNVGIGTTNSEEYPLFIKGSNISSGGGQAALCILDDGTAYNGTNPGGGITFRGKYNNSGSTTNFGTVQGVKENTTDGNYATALSFTTRSNGGNLLQRLRLASGGRVYTCDTMSGGPHRFHVNNRVSIASNGSKTHTITNLYTGYATLRIAYSDGNAQYVHFVAELGGHMWTSSNGYNVEVVTNQSSTISISVTKNLASYVVTVNAGSNYAYGSIELSGASFTENSGATYAFS